MTATLGSTDSRVSTPQRDAETYSHLHYADGYISFPDFEKFCQSQNPYDQHREHTAVKT